MLSLSSKHIYSEFMDNLVETEPRELMKDDASDFIDSDNVKEEKEDLTPEQFQQKNEVEHVEEKQDEPESETEQTPEAETKTSEDPKAEESPENQPDSQETESQDSVSDQAKQEIEKLRKQFDGLKKDYEKQKKDEVVTDQIKKLKKQIENIDSQDDSNLNDSIIQTAHRNIRRIKKAVLNSKLINLVEREYLANPHLDTEELAHLISNKHKEVSMKDVYRFLESYDKTRAWKKLM